MKNSKLSYLFQFLFSFFFILGIVLIILGFNNYKIIDLHYHESNNIDYKVYLKKNNFFEEPYLGENETYISSLIDYIDINYHYNIEYSLPISGSYTYKMVAVVSANKPNSDGYYWQKSYDLTDEKTGVINDSNNLSLDQNIKIEYDKYNEILNSFKKVYSFASDGELKVIMVINNLANYDLLDEPIVVNSDVSLVIPLLEQTVEATIDKNINSTSDSFKIRVRDKSLNYLFYKIFGILLLASSICYFVCSGISKISYRRKNGYETYLKKILKSYDSIIANVNSKPSLSGLKIIEVSDFSELLDIYNEVRMPINYYQDSSKKVSTFIIYNENFVWIYELRKENFVEGGNNSVKKENPEN